MSHTSDVKAALAAIDLATRLTRSPHARATELGQLAGQLLENRGDTRAKAGDDTHVTYAAMSALCSACTSDTANLTIIATAISACEAGSL